MLTLEILAIPQPVARDRTVSSTHSSLTPAYSGLLRFPSPGRLFIGLHWQLSDHQIPSVFLSRNMARAVASKAELALY